MGAYGPVTSPSTFLRTIPVMTVNDLDQSLAFFARLGFQIHHRQGGFAIAKRDAVEIHFTHHPEMSPEANHSVCRIVVTNSDALYQEILSMEALPYRHLSPLTIQPWGDKEINLVDPCGILIRFSEPARPEETVNRILPNHGG